MSDPRLQELMAIQMRTPFPPECRGFDIDGVELVLLDAGIYGVATWYGGNDDPLTPAHRATLATLLDDLDRIWDRLPTEHARIYYTTVRDVGRYLLASRASG